MAGGREGNIFSLVYSSVCAVDASHPDFHDGISRIDRSSSLRNAEFNVTGFLFHFDNHFLQVIEGRFDDVISIYRMIEASRFHRDCFIIDAHHVKARHFISWSMQSSFKLIMENYGGHSLNTKFAFLRRFFRDAEHKSVVIRDVLIAVADELERMAIRHVDAA